MESGDLQDAPAQGERWARPLATQNGFKAGAASTPFRRVESVWVKED